MIHNSYLRYHKFDSSWYPKALRWLREDKDLVLCVSLSLQIAAYYYTCEYWVYLWNTPQTPFLIKQTLSPEAYCNCLWIPIFRIECKKFCGYDSSGNGSTTTGFEKVLLSSVTYRFINIINATYSIYLAMTHVENLLLVHVYRMPNV